MMVQQKPQFRALDGIWVIRVANTLLFVGTSPTLGSVDFIQLVMDIIH